MAIGRSMDEDPEVEAQTLVGGKGIWEEPDEDVKEWRRRRNGWMGLPRLGFVLLFIDMGSIYRKREVGSSD